jgi:hypothetical protein
MDDRCGRGPGGDGDGDGGKSHCCMKLAANKESFVLEVRFMGDEEEVKVGDQAFQVVVGISTAIFMGDIVVGRKVETPTVRDARWLDLSQAMNALRSRIHQPRRHSTGDSGAFLFL